MSDREIECVCVCVCASSLDLLLNCRTSYSRAYVESALVSMATET